MPPPTRCPHTDLALDPWPSTSAYQAPSPEAILAATQPTSRPPPARQVPLAPPAGGNHAGPTLPPPPHPLLPPISSGTFPALLALPGDALDIDPDDEEAEEAQNVRSWRAEPCRNKLDGAAGSERARRRVIYVVPPPNVEGRGEGVPGWLENEGDGGGNGRQRKGGKGKKVAKKKKREGGGGGEVGSSVTETPAAEDVARYLAAFYWPLEVRVWGEDDGAGGEAAFVPWQGDEGDEDGNGEEQVVGLRFGDQCFRIRHRTPIDGAFEGQLNLNDLLDGVIGILPADAYAACLLVRQDMYEDEDDDFCCGRAYGGSRIACVSFARYRPGLYVETPGEERHCWPGSHCAAFVGECEGRDGEGGVAGVLGEGTAIRAAVDAVETVKQDRAALWLSRVCKTTVHELGHCFGIAHCVYAACLMQATAGLEEDERQPPYLCPVDLMKLAWAMEEAGAVDMGSGTGTRGTKDARGRSRRADMASRVDVKQWLCRRYRALRDVCGTRIGADRMSTAFDAWLVYRLAEIDGLGSGNSGRPCPRGALPERPGQRAAGTRHVPTHAREVVVLSSDSEEIDGTG